MTSASSPTIIGSAAVALFNRGPVVTLFTPPTSCVSTLTAATGGTSLFFGHNYGQYYDPSCFPTGSTNSASQSDPWGLYWYSPAQCPSGWSSFPIDAYQYTYSTTVIYLDSANKIALCCPGGYTSVPSGSHVCETKVFGIAPTTAYYKKPTNIGNSEFISTDPTPAPVTFLGGSAGSTDVIGGDGIVVIWQITDVTAFISRSATRSTSSTSSNTISTTSTTSTSPPANTTSSASKSGGLSTGAKIGMGVGIPAFVIFLAIAGFFCYRRRMVKKGLNIPLYAPDTQPVKKIATPSPHRPYSRSPTHNGLYSHQYQGSPPPREEAHSILQQHSETQSPTVRTHNPMETPRPHDLPYP